MEETLKKTIKALGALAQGCDISIHASFDGAVIETSEEPFTTVPLLVGALVSEAKRCEDQTTEALLLKDSVRTILQELEKITEKEEEK